MAGTLPASSCWVVLPSPLHSFAWRVPSSKRTERIYVNPMIFSNQAARIAPCQRRRRRSSASPKVGGTEQHRPKGGWWCVSHSPFGLVLPLLGGAASSSSFGVVGPFFVLRLSSGAFPRTFLGGTFPPLSYRVLLRARLNLRGAAFRRSLGVVKCVLLKWIRSLN